MPIGPEYGQSIRHFGLRTFALAAVVSCAVLLVGMSALDRSDGRAWVIQGIITAIGFVADGAMLKDQDRLQPNDKG
jgi:uncharacterized membrane protein YhiD involved in acid resistance